MHTLFIGHNKIRTWDEIAKFASLPELKTLLLSGNMIYDSFMTFEEYCPNIVKRVP